jgi:hypothetical protein
MARYEANAIANPFHLRSLSSGYIPLGAIFFVDYAALCKKARDRPPQAA